MKETILLYHVSDEIKNIIEIICQQLDVEVKCIKDTDIYQKMGYLLGIEGYERLENQETSNKMEKELLFFAGMSKEQLDILLDVFKAADIPFIPYKAMLTESNIEYLFYQLYENVAHEYEQISNNVNKKAS